MLERFKSALCRIGRKGKFLISAMAVSAVAVVSTAVASAEETTNTGITEVINTAGTTLTAQFTTLVNTLVPVAVSIGVVGLGLYACIYLFKIAKQFFAKAAG